MFAKGFRYGVASAALMFILLPGIILGLGAHWSEALLGGGANAIFFGVIGFAIGCASHRQRPSDPLDIRVDTRPSKLKHWGYRFLAGVLLGLSAWGTVALFFGGLLWLCYGNPEEIERLPRDPVRIADMILSAATAGAYSALVGAFLGTLLAPSRLEGSAVLKYALISAGVATLAGACGGGSVCLLSPLFFLTVHAQIVSTVAIGLLAGVVIAIVLRLRDSWWREEPGTNAENSRMGNVFALDSAEETQASEAIKAAEDQRHFHRSNILRRG